MRRLFGLVLVSLTLLLAFTGGAAEEKAQFSGPAGHFEESTDFVNFIFNHQKETVRLDVDFAEEEFAGSLEEPGETASFVLWEECEELPEGEAPGTSWCTGTEFSVDHGDPQNNKKKMTLWAGVYRLKGFFRIVGCGGPHQGLMGCTLTALAPEEAM